MACALFAAVGCNQVSRLLDLDPSAQSPVARPTVTPPRAIASQTRCCWCVLKERGQNSVQAYVSRDMCEDRSGKGEFSTCRSVEVIGSACSLVRVSPQGGKLNCAANPLRYSENGVIKTIAPPDDFELTCRARVLVRAQQARIGQLVENTDPNAPTADDGYCSCEQDLDNPLNCRVVKITRGIPNVLDSKPRREGQNSCTRAVCFSIFDESAFRANCPRYVDGEP